MVKLFEKSRLFDARFEAEGKKEAGFEARQKSVAVDETLNNSSIYEKRDAIQHPLFVLQI